MTTWTRVQILLFLTITSKSSENPSLTHCSPQYLKRTWLFLIKHNTGTLLQHLILPLTFLCADKLVRVISNSYPVVSYTHAPFLLCGPSKQHGALRQLNQGCITQPSMGVCWQRDCWQCFKSPAVGGKTGQSFWGQLCVTLLWDSHTPRNYFKGV